MDVGKKFLADRLLSEEQPVTYRLLSRALNVHVNTAKEMLYDFHEQQNASKANSIHATYLICGTKTPEGPLNGGDVEMSSSIPEQEPLSEEVPTTTITLVAEERLQDTLAEYQNVSSIHVYSLSPHPQKDLSMLADVSQALSEYTNDDAANAAHNYGIIPNPHVRRRTRQGHSRAPLPSTSKLAQGASSGPSKPTQATKVKQEAADAPSKYSTPSSSAGKPSASAAKKPAPAGGIMSSFAKAAAKPAKPKPPPVKKEEDDTTMALSDDGEADDTDIAPSKKKSEEEIEAQRTKRKQREEELRRMMEEDDDDEEGEDEEEAKEEEAADEEMEEAPEPEKVEEEKADETKEPSEVVSSTGDGRRRGKRRVMKKKRILDDQGYMVTIQEQGWESFSEDEAPTAASKKTTSTPAASGTPASSTGAKAKKPAGKQGQGNIMSFFGKK